MSLKTDIIKLIDIGFICKYNKLDSFVDTALKSGELTESESSDIYKYMDSKIVKNEDMKVNSK